MVNSKSGEIRSASVPPFLKKCYEIVDDETTDAIISWSESSDSFVIWDMTQFSVRLLPLYFKHGNFSSFMRQLNIYGFRKIDTDRWEFANDGFVRGQKHLLKNICRRKNVNGPDQRKALPQEDNSDGPCDKIENIGLWKEVENLKIDKNAIMQEFIKLRQHQETAGDKLLVLSDRLQGMEKNQQQMLSFLVMAVQNPGFLVQLLKLKENNWRMAEAGNMLEEGTEDDRPVVSDGMIVRYQPPVDEIPKPAPVHTQIPGPEKQPKANPSPDGMNDFFLNPDFIKMLMDEKLSSLDNHAPFILPDLPDDGAWEQLLLSSPFLENTEDTKLDTEGTEMEMEESTETETQFKNSQNFELLIEQMEKSQNLELLTDQMGLLSSDPDQNYGSQ